MRYLTRTLRLLPGLQVRGAALGTLPMWRDEHDQLHFDDACHGGAPVPMTAAQLTEAADDERICADCDSVLSPGPWARVLREAGSLQSRAVLYLRHPPTTTGGWPDYPLPRWVQTANLAATVADGRLLAEMLATAEAAGELPRPAVRELRRWLGEAVANGEAVLAALRGELTAGLDLTRVCWRYVEARYTPALPADMDPAEARKLRSAWLTALRHGRSPAMAALDATGRRIGHDPAAEAVIAQWRSEAERIITASLDEPWHDVAIVEPRQARMGVLYTRKGQPMRRGERRHFALAYFPGELIVEHDVLLLRAPALIAAGLADRSGLSFDLGVSPAFPTPEHLQTALRLRSSGGAMAHLGRATLAARAVLHPSGRSFVA